jgi:UDPglucose--hexose-1-phosphate uridylyltransferase
MELRKDYLLDRFVIISEARGKRPFDISGHAGGKDTPNTANSSFAFLPVDNSCVFCVGNESKTPPEKGHVGEPWKIRWMDNKFSALAPTGKFNLQTDNKYFTFSDAYGYHEVIIETNDHRKQFSDLSDFELKDLFKVYKSVIKDLSSKEHIQYVLLFKNHGPAAGTSLTHSHTQIAALSHVPFLVRQELDAVKRYDACPYCEIINIEKGSYRRCFENNSFVAFTPYASRFNYEIWVFPKKHYLSLTQLDDAEFLELGNIMHQIVSKLKIMNASYNFAIHNTPEQDIAHDGKLLHFHIEIMPRIDTWAGFENGAQEYINRVSPEDAAAFYRGEKQ